MSLVTFFLNAIYLTGSLFSQWLFILCVAGSIKWSWYILTKPMSMSWVLCVIILVEWLTIFLLYLYDWRQDPPTFQCLIHFPYWSHQNILYLMILYHLMIRDHWMDHIFKVVSSIVVISNYPNVLSFFSLIFFNIFPDYNFFSTVSKFQDL